MLPFNQHKYANSLTNTFFVLRQTHYRFRDYRASKYEQPLKTYSRFKIKKFCFRFCATDRQKSLDILSRLRTLEILEKEIVPACHRLYYNTCDVGARSHLRTLRTFWKSEFDSLEASILDIVDATALCAVIDEEARLTASEIKKRTYAQVNI